MQKPPDTTASTGIQHRRPRVGERTRGAVVHADGRVQRPFQAQRVGPVHVEGGPQGRAA